MTQQRSSMVKNGKIQPLTTRDAEIYGDAHTSEQRARKEEYVDARYKGPRADLKDQKGAAYMDREDESCEWWLFRPLGSEEWYRVKFGNLAFIPKRVKKKKKDGA